MLSSDLLTDAEARAANTQFAALITAVNLDRKLRANPAMAARFEGGLTRAIRSAYPDDGAGVETAHWLLHRALYRVNRLGMFSYDDLGLYTNERSPYLMAVRERIERAWQDWEARQLDVPALRRLEAPLALRARVRADLDPPVSATSEYFAHATSASGYCRLVQLAALEGLSEAGLLARAIAGPANEVQATLTRVLVERQRQSAFFTTMLEACGLPTEPEAHFDLVPWEALASLNHAFLLSGRRRHFLRYIGACLYRETAAPAIFGAYRAAARRLGLTAQARGYWDRHVEHGKRHGRWLLDGVALPLAAHYRADAWEIVLGYDQHKLIAERAAAAVARSARDADQVATLRAAA
jgi:heme oxygenase-like protein